jgi:hypothetical protein
VYQAMFLKPGCRTWWTTMSWAEASVSRSAILIRHLANFPWTLPHHQSLPRRAFKHNLPLLHPVSTTSRSFHPFYATSAYLGMIMPFLVYLRLASLSSQCTTALTYVS